MILRLKPQWLLRRYDDCHCVLIDRASGAGTIVDAAIFGLLIECDGRNDFQQDFLRGNKRLIEEGLRKGFLEEVPEIKPISEDQRLVTYENRYIERSLWAMTGRCNSHCRHCYLAAGEQRLNEMPLELALRLVDEMADCGIHRVSLTGGETLVRHGFWRILDALLGYGIHVERLFTNGMLVNKRMLENCDARQWIPLISISFDGIGHHDWIRGVDVAEKLALGALRLCQEKGFPTEVEYCLHRGNLDTFEQTIDLLENLGVRHIQINPLELIGSGRNLDANCLRPEEFFEFAARYLPVFLQRKHRAALHFRHFVGVEGGKVVLTDAEANREGQASSFRLCGHAEHELYIGIDGKLMPCLALDQESIFREAFPVWDGTRPLSELIHHPVFHKLFSLSYGKFLAKNSECRRCAFKEQCAGGCRGKNACKDNVYIIDPWQCAFFKGGYFQKFQELKTSYA